MEGRIVSNHTSRIKYVWERMRKRHIEKPGPDGVFRLRWPDGRTKIAGAAEVWTRRGEDGAKAEIRVYDFGAMGGAQAALAIIREEEREAERKARRREWRR
jgi:hypothetical protein